MRTQINNVGCGGEEGNLITHNWTKEHTEELTKREQQQYMVMSTAMARKETQVPDWGPSMNLFSY